MTTKRISPYTRLLREYRAFVSDIFSRTKAGQKAIVAMPADDYLRGAIESAETLGHVCMARIEGQTLVIYARPAIKGEDVPWAVYETWMMGRKL